MKSGTTGTLLFLLIGLSMVAAAKDKREWKTGTLLSITDSSSNRIISNSQTGAVQTVTDIEYRISVLVDGMIYVGSYWPRFRWSYAPTDLVVNDPIDISIEGKDMYIKRPGNNELKTKVIQRIRQDDHTKAQPLSPPVLNH
jgi:hypothetical protein